jgi:hypothetical protein
MKEPIQNNEQNLSRDNNPLNFELDVPEYNLSKSLQAHLDRMGEEAIRGLPQGVMVIGSVGIGKSNFLHKLWLEPEKHRVLNPIHWPESRELSPDEFNGEVLGDFKPMTSALKPQTIRRYIGHLPVFISSTGQKDLASIILSLQQRPCNHEYSDGTGTGYYVCKHCGDMY